MADEKTVSADIPIPSRPAVETVVARGAGVSSAQGEAARSSGDAAVVDLDALERELDEGLADGDGEGAEGSTPSGDSGDEGGPEVQPEGDGDETAGLADLGDFDPANDEVVAKFDAAYLTESGQLNTERLTTEFWSGMEKAREALKDGETLPTTGFLPKATYDWIKDTFKVDDAFIQQFEEGQVLRGQKADAEFFESVGGPENYSKALQWARGGGYDEAAQTRFNKLAANPKSPEFREAVDALLFRASKAGVGVTPGGEPRKGPRIRDRRPSTARRDATAGAAGASGAAGGETYADQKAMDSAFAEARRMAKAATTAADKAKAEQFYQQVRTKAARTQQSQRKG